MIRTDPKSDVAQPPEAVLADLIEEITEKIEADEHVDLTQYEAQHPALASQLARLVPALQALDDLGLSVASSANGQPVSTETTSGQLGDFRILQEIGRGGMGVVYEAEQLSLGRRVALKVLPFAAMLDKQQLNRFKNEARAAATLDHPNIVAVHSVGEQRGVHYYAMQLVEGQSLAEVIAARRQRSEVGLQSSESSSGDADATIEHISRSTPLAAKSSLETKPVAALSTVPNSDTQQYFRTAAQLGIQAAKALDHAHQNGIVHRDVKPGNLLLDSAGKLYVTDFGLARIEADAGMTMTGDLLGTLAYMSPEQALAKRVVIDHRTDIYSLGVTLYELLTLQKPYEGSDRQELLKQIAFDEARPLRRVNRQIPEDLETIVGKAMEKSPEDRYATAANLAEDLQAFLEHRSIAAKPPSLLLRITKWTRRNAAAVSAAAIVFAVLGIFTAWQLTSTYYQTLVIQAATQTRLAQAYEALAADQIGLSQIALAEAKESSKQRLDAEDPLLHEIASLQEELTRYQRFSSLFQEARRQRSHRAYSPAKEALQVYSAIEGNNWRAVLREARAPQQHIDRLSEQIYELLIGVAHDNVLWLNLLDSEPLRLQAISEAESILELAADLRQPTKGYYWVRSCCEQRMGDKTEGDVRALHDAEALRLRALADQTQPQNATELFYISRDRKWGASSQYARPAFRRPYAGDDDELAAYREMLRIDPRYYNALFFTGLQLLDGRIGEALQAFNGCIAIQPLDLTARNNKADCLQQMGRLDEAEAEIRRAIELAEQMLVESPESAQTKERLALCLQTYGVVLRDSGKTAAAREALQKSLSIQNELMKGDGVLRKANQGEREQLADLLSQLEQSSTSDLENQRSKKIPSDGESDEK